MRVLTPRSDMTGADRAWAARYEVGDILHYAHGSKELGIDSRSYARVIATTPNDNLVTVRKENGESVSYNPSRLRGIAAYREIDREFAVGDRLQFTAPNRALGVANRDIGTLESIDEHGRMTVHLNGGTERTFRFDPKEMRHFDHGYAVTSHSSQGLTAERVLVNMDTTVHRELLNSRFAYVSVSRASHDAQIYTDNKTDLAQKLIHQVAKSSALEITTDPLQNTDLRQTSRFKQQSGIGIGLAL